MGSEERRRRHVGRFISATVLGVALAASVTLTGSAAVPASARHMSSNSPPAYQDGVLLVGFDKSMSQQQQANEVASAGATDTRTVGVGVHILHVPPGQVLSAARRLSTQPGIRYAEPDYIEYESGVPNDPSFGLQWGYQNTGQTVNNISGTPGADERAVQAWNITTGSRSIVIGEADTGVDYMHPDLAANIWSNPGGVGGCAAGTHGYNVISSTCDPMDDDTVYGGHGTHVAGILGAVGNNGIGVTGVNWTTTILPVKWEQVSGAATTSNLIIGLDWLLKAKQAGVNVRVVNDSNTLCCPSQALSDEIDLLGGNGILFVTAASNFGANNDDPALRRYPCGFERPTEICVAATNQQDQLPTWANYGPTTVDLAAPGDNVYSTLRNATYGFVSGSSMASPQVAGAAALILSVQEMSPQALKADILENVDLLSSLSGRVRTGGRLDICRAVPGCTQSSPPALFNVTPPSISGFTQQGQTLTATAGDWTGGPTSYTYQWRRCSSSGSSCANVAGATSASYQLVGADVGSTMQVAVTAKVGTNTATGYSPPSSTVQGANLSANPSTVNPGGRVTASWSSIPSPAVGDWIGLYSSGAADSAYLTYRYTGGAASGSLSFSIPASLSPGTYELRLFLNYSQTHVAISGPITVQAITLSASPSPVNPGSTVTAGWSGIVGPAAGDWIGLYSSGAADSAYLSYRYTGGTASGSVTFGLSASFSPGTYELRFFPNYSQTHLVTSGPISVQAITLSASPSPVNPGSTVTAGWSGIVGPAAGDWIGLYSSGAADSAYLSYRYTGGTASGSVTFSLSASLSPGTYELRLFRNYSQTHLVTSGPISVQAITLSASPSTVNPGTTVTAGWSGIVGPAAGDWIGLYSSGAADSAYLSYRYTGGTASGSVTFSLSASLSPGTYELRLFRNYSQTHLVTSGPISVQAVTLSVTPSTVNAGGTVTAGWSGIVSPAAGDWIGLYSSGAADSAYLSYRYTGGTPSGSLSFSIPASLTPGTYELRLFRNYSQTHIATSGPITVS